jgi:putative transposase
MTMVGVQTEQRYPSDVTDEQWTAIEPLIPVKTGSGTGPGKPRSLNMRQVVNALCYLEHTGCQWRYLPKDFPNYNSVRYYYDSWRKDGTWERIQALLGNQDAEQEGPIHEVPLGLSQRRNGKPHGGADGDGSAHPNLIEPRPHNRRYAARQKAS